MPLLANLGKPEGAADAVALGAEGVGLFRTEFLFLERDQAPTVEQQRESYTQLLAAFPGKKVVVRVLDAGADKPLAFLNDAHEENPALGLRGIRALRASEDILREQLTALAEADAATDADLWVMAPMVATVEETEYFTDVARDYGIKTAGVMVEVPSSALLADRILAYADFASIGTNDLTQYTLAADRLLGSVARFQDPWHPAVLRLIREVGDAGREPRQAGRHLRRGGGRSAARGRARGPRRDEPVDGAHGARRRAGDAAAALPRRCPRHRRGRPGRERCGLRQRGGPGRRHPTAPRRAARASRPRERRHSNDNGVSARQAAGSKARVGVQRFGTFLSGMIMPNIPALIAWGIFTAFFIRRRMDAQRRSSRRSSARSSTTCCRSSSPTPAATSSTASAAASSPRSR